MPDETMVVRRKVSRGSVGSHSRRFSEYSDW
jgi:hypothetical protein